MSIDYYVYLKQTLPDKSAYESFAKTLGFQITVHPEIEFMNNTGFCPIRLTDTRFADKNGADTFLTGFELYHDDFQPSKPTVSVSKGFFGLFRKKIQPEETPFDLAVKDSTVVLSLNCSGMDSFDVLMAYVFGEYCVKYCNAVFDDPQYGCFYNDTKAIEAEISRIVDELCEEKETGGLHTQRFEEWR